MLGIYEKSERLRVVRAWQSSFPARSAAKPFQDSGLRQQQPRIIEQLTKLGPSRHSNASAICITYFYIMAPTKRNPKAAKSEREVGSNANANGERDSNQGDDLGSQGGEGLDLYSMAEKMMQSVSTCPALYHHAPPQDFEDSEATRKQTAKDPARLRQRDACNRGRYDCHLQRERQAHVCLKRRPKYEGRVRN